MPIICPNAILPKSPLAAASTLHGKKTSNSSFERRFVPFRSTYLLFPRKKPTIIMKKRMMTCSKTVCTMPCLLFVSLTGILFLRFQQVCTGIRAGLYTLCLYTLRQSDCSRLFFTAKSSIPAPQGSFNKEKPAFCEPFFTYQPVFTTAMPFSFPQEHHFFSTAFAKLAL